jgi:hypothetical protein
MTTDQEQDLLRAMIVFAASGLDAALKQLIRDSVPILIRASEAVHDAFEKFAQRRIQAGETEVGMVSPKILARILAAPDPQKQLVEDYVYELTGDSLQSAEQLLKACAALGVDAKNAIGDVQTLKDVFAARNQIIHELDMNLASSNRKRRLRAQDKMQQYAERLLQISAAVIADVDARISA